VLSVTELEVVDAIPGQPAPLLFQLLKVTLPVALAQFPAVKTSTVVVEGLGTWAVIEQLN
jgi:hypothetical protein